MVVGVLWLGDDQRIAFGQERHLVRVACRAAGRRDLPNPHALPRVGRRPRLALQRGQHKLGMRSRPQPVHVLQRSGIVRRR